MSCWFYSWSKDEKSTKVKPFTKAHWTKPLISAIPFKWVDFGLKFHCQHTGLIMLLWYCNTSLTHGSASNILILPLQEYQVFWHDVPMSIHSIMLSYQLLWGCNIFSLPSGLIIMTWQIISALCLPAQVWRRKSYQWCPGWGPGQTSYHK